MTRIDHDCRDWPGVCWCEDRDYAEEEYNRRTYLDPATREDRDEIDGCPGCCDARAMPCGGTPHRLCDDCQRYWAVA